VPAPDLSVLKIESSSSKLASVNLTEKPTKSLRLDKITASESKSAQWIPDTKKPNHTSQDMSMQLQENVYSLEAVDSESEQEVGLSEDHVTTTLAGDISNHFTSEEANNFHEFDTILDFRREDGGAMVK
jgi:hypothetical protein